MEVEKEGRKERRKTWMETRRKNGFKGLEASISGRENSEAYVSRSVAVFFRLDRVDELAHYDTKIYLDLQRGKN